MAPATGLRHGGSRITMAHPAGGGGRTGPFGCGTIGRKEHLMHPMITAKLDEVADLCRRHHVRRLDLFGSGANGRFDPGRSDLDFIAEWEPAAPKTLATYFDLRDDLAALFDRDIDLLDARVKLENPYFAENVAESRQTIYAEP